MFALGQQPQGSPQQGMPQTTVAGSLQASATKGGTFDAPLGSTHGASTTSFDRTPSPYLAFDQPPAAAHGDRAAAVASVYAQYRG